jgi:periplasmic divalent cation tolerance protein
MADEYSLVYMTAGSKEEAEAVADALVEESLAACVNIIDGMMSVYRWQGELHHDEEVVLIAKTTERCLEALTDRVKVLHSYDCPCIVAVHLEGRNPAFFEWISRQINF